MKRVLPVLMVFGVFLFSTGEGFALPECNGSPRTISDYKEVTSWSNCDGAVTFGSGGGRRTGNKYVGEWKNGNIHGHGTYTWSSGQKYVGEWKNKKFHGQGTYTSGNEKYVGEYRDGKWNGQGTYTSVNEKYVGVYKDGKKNGHFTVTYANGNKYVAEYKDGKLHGKGTMFHANGTVEECIWGNVTLLCTKKTSPTVTAQKSSTEGRSLTPCPSSQDLSRWTDCVGTYNSSSGDKYVGEWKNGKEHGQGTLTYADGRVYQEGIFEKGKFLFAKKLSPTVTAQKSSTKRNSLPRCKGSYNKTTWTNCVGNTILPEGVTPVNTGDRYQGEWKDGKPNGQGTLTGVKNGKFKYVGGFKNGGADGQGTLTSPGWGTYVGEWKSNKMNGQGTYTFGKTTKFFGDKYAGEWKDGKQHGQGTYTHGETSTSFGQKYVGEYRDGKQHGQGTLTTVEGDKYVGEYRDGKQHGKGTYTWSKSNGGQKYVGEWKSGKQHGKGTLFYTDVDGIVYQEGIWGNGEFKSAKKSSRKGRSLPPCRGSPSLSTDLVQRKFGRRVKTITLDQYYLDWTECFGTYTFIYGTDGWNKYVGEWKDNKKDGQGTETTSEGDKYVGGWYHDRYNEFGTLTYADGKVEEGMWVNGYIQKRITKAEILRRKEKQQKRKQARKECGRDCPPEPEQSNQPGLGNVERMGVVDGKTLLCKKGRGDIKDDEGLSAYVFDKGLVLNQWVDPNYGNIVSTGNWSIYDTSVSKICWLFRCVNRQTLILRYKGTRDRKIDPKLFLAYPEYRNNPSYQASCKLMNWKEIKSVLKKRGEAIKASRVRQLKKNKF